MRSAMAEIEALIRDILTMIGIGRSALLSEVGRAYGIQRRPLEADSQYKKRLSLDLWALASGGMAALAVDQSGRVWN